MREKIRAQEECRAKDEVILKMQSELEEIKNKQKPKGFCLKSLHAERNKRKL